MERFLDCVIYAHQLNSASMMIINRSKAVLVESENSGAGTVLDLPETLFAVNDEGELTHMAPICKDLQLPLDCSAFRFLSLDPCIIIANTGNFSTERLGNLEWISINLMRDHLTSVKLHALSHNLDVACRAVQHSRPEVWKQSFPPPTDRTPQNKSLGVMKQSDLLCSSLALRHLHHYGKDAWTNCRNNTKSYTTTVNCRVHRSEQCIANARLHDHHSPTTSITWKL